MSHEVPEISLKAMLMVPDGPPAAVWERALQAAFAAGEEDGGADGLPTDATAGAAETGEGADADDDADEDDDAGDEDPDLGGVPAGNFAVEPDASLDGNEPGPDGWYSEDEPQSDGDDVQY